jgi:hypothetical protein
MSKRVNLIVLAVVAEKIRDSEDFTDFIRRMREKYVEALGTEDVTLKALK